MKAEHDILRCVQKHMLSNDQVRNGVVKETLQSNDSITDVVYFMCQFVHGWYWFWFFSCLRFFECRRGRVEDSLLRPSKKARHPKISLAELIKKSEEDYIKKRQDGLWATFKRSILLNFVRLKWNEIRIEHRRSEIPIQCSAIVPGSPAAHLGGVHSWSCQNKADLQEWETTTWVPHERSWLEAPKRPQKELPLCWCRRKDHNGNRHKAVHKPSEVSELSGWQRGCQRGICQSPWGSCRKCAGEHGGHFQRWDEKGISAVFLVKSMDWAGFYLVVWCAILSHISPASTQCFLASMQFDLGPLKNITWKLGEAKLLDWLLHLKKPFGKKQIQEIFLQIISHIQSCLGTLHASWLQFIPVKWKGGNPTYDVI